MDWKAELVDNKAFSYTDKLFDKKLRVPDDYAIKLKLNKLPPEATHIFFCIRLENLSDVQPNQFQYTRYRLTDFDINYAFDQQEFETKYQVSDLLGQGQAEGGVGEEEDLEEGKGAAFFTYYLHKDAKWGWFLENLNS